MRYRLEKWLIDGHLNADDLEYVWNEEFAKDFGLSIKYPSDGVLQDVHWSEGLFGYFPTYSLGNVYAGCLFEAMQNQLPSLNKNLKSGNYRKLPNGFQAQCISMVRCTRPLS